MPKIKRVRATFQDGTFEEWEGTDVTFTPLVSTVGVYRVLQDEKTIAMVHHPRVIKEYSKFVEDDHTIPVAVHSLEEDTDADKQKDETPELPSD